MPVPLVGVGQVGRRLAVVTEDVRATTLERLLGRTGTIVITRLLGMLLAALSVQFVIDGVRGTGMIG